MVIWSTCTERAPIDHRVIGSHLALVRQEKEVTWTNGLNLAVRSYETKHLLSFHVFRFTVSFVVVPALSDGGEWLQS